MQLNDNIVSGIKLKNIYFKKINMVSSGKKCHDESQINASFSLSTDVLEDNRMVIDLNSEITISDIAKLTLTLTGEAEYFGERKIIDFLPNIVAIMFPYLRSQVSLMTAQPNLPTVVIPAININKLLSSVKKES